MEAERPRETEPTAQGGTDRRGTLIGVRKEELNLVILPFSSAALIVYTSLGAPPRSRNWNDDRGGGGFRDNRGGGGGGYGGGRDGSGRWSTTGGGGGGGSWGGDRGGSNRWGVS